jgi:hypothetical protein
MPDFRPGPIQEPIGETAPKRGPTKPGPKPGAAAARKTASLKPQIASMLITMNLALYIIPPLRVDVLDEVEIEALARGLDEQAKASPRFRKYLEGAIAAGSGGTLMATVAIIGMRRASRHGMLPEVLDQPLGNMLAQGLDAAPKKPADGG